MPIVTPKTVYTNDVPSKYFYSIERHGFVKVSEAVHDFVTESLAKGIFAVKHATIIETYRSANVQTNIRNLSNVAAINTIFTSNYAVNTGTTWSSARERMREVGTAGNGYSVGNQLIGYDGANTAMRLSVTAIDSSTGGITDFTVVHPGSYNTPVNANRATSFRVNNTNSFSINQDYSYGPFTFQGNVVNGTGGAVTPPPPSSNSGDPTTWVNNYGSNGIGPTTYSLTPGGFGTASPSGAGTRWPVTGIWSNVDNFESKVFVGQEIILLSSLSGTSSIPPGTLISNVQPISVVTGYTSQGIDSWRETVSRWCYFVLSNPVTVTKGDTFAVRGSGFTVNDTTTREPEAFKVIMEAQARVDPLNDSNGVEGNVVAAQSSGNIVVINNLSNRLGNNLPPAIYPGMTIESVLTNGTVTSATVVTANVVGTTANIRLTSNQSITNGEGVRLRFTNLQPWRLAFEVVHPQMAITYAATDVQLQDDGTISRVTNYEGKVVDRSGMMGNSFVKYSGGVIVANDTVDETRSDQLFYNRKVRVGDYPQAFPLNYMFTATNRGLFFGMWEGNWSTAQKSQANFQNQKDNWFNWFLVQRPVDRITGRTLTTGKAPVFCINSVAYQYWKFIVREADAAHPTQGDPEQVSEYWNGTTVVTRTTPFRVPADQHTDDSHAILNTTDQIALTEDSKFLVSFLHNLTTPRFRYSEELDMVGQTSADVCMAGNDLSITAYSETGARTYRALPSNKPYNTGLRICVLKGVTA
jgi:hypothetical protein